MKTKLVAVTLWIAGMPAFAHRLDEYLQGTLLSVGKNRLEAQMVLTPGIAVLPIVLGEIDGNRDGMISDAEQRAYAGKVLRDLTLTMDGHRLAPRMVSVGFPAIEEMKDGRGEIRIEFQADLPPGGPNRRLVLENHHASRIAVYQVNCLVPLDPDIRIASQNRNYTQSTYELEYVQAGVGSSPLSPEWWWGDRGWLLAVGLLLSARLMWLWRGHSCLPRPDSSGRFFPERHRLPTGAVFRGCRVSTCEHETPRRFLPLAYSRSDGTGVFTSSPASKGGSVPWKSGLPRLPIPSPIPWSR